MSGLHLVRLPIAPPRLMRFAHAHGITQEDETWGYTLHAWFAALFGEHAPKPFRYVERRREVLAYAGVDAAKLLEHAQTYASPLAWEALDAAGVASKPMPSEWRAGQRLHLEVLACPVSRKEGDEKDVYLRALDRLGDAAPPRGEVYREWFARQWQGVVQLEQVELLGMAAQARLLRRDHRNGHRLKTIERPWALFDAEATILDPVRFGEQLARGIGRHRAFGFGMVLLAPPR
ncbi:type I-E CRISPR-associated protein Cas6/Cse3/CasE [Caldimonas taiwanensis]|uniref:type I-E CRISPR-associated protein Cas6/Cse3/CasE n=1 Tax=Caldimonas taiwanensis TaxID=307483 RepID=UPI0007814F01|nr:type I-E CRISPR-associated protein Cas6/Cse3/CasE [Caldimonas taiwanensis]